VPSTPPEGEPAPPDGALPPSVGARTDRTFGVYVHVPFCATRCGYCDFNTYTSAELGDGADPGTYADTVVAELDLARRVLGPADRPARTVFVGGGTPTLLPPSGLGRVVRAVGERFGLADGADVTTEANPESVDRRALDELRGGGFTRISFGMQSARDHVLAVLDRTHSPGRAGSVVAEARAAGFEHINVDLIYGTPGESDDDWRASLDAAVATGADHVSAYALIVEPGTRLAARVQRGELPAPDDDVLAHRYVMAEETLSSAGLQWYEVSNWARDEDAQSRHNLGYWTDADWWGIGPGAHSHVDGVRWWNVRHPAAYAQRLHDGISPAQAREVLDDEARRWEDVMLRLRLREGLPLDRLHDSGSAAARRAVDDGLLDAAAYDGGVAVLTLRGRLLADAVVRALVD
jgi:putative oxygen-independent coproporphyrinogen III oxidase